MHSTRRSPTTRANIHYAITADSFDRDLGLVPIRLHCQWRSHVRFDQSILIAYLSEHCSPRIVQCSMIVYRCFETSRFVINWFLFGVFASWIPYSNWRRPFDLLCVSTFVNGTFLFFITTNLEKDLALYQLQKRNSIRRY